MKLAILLFASFLFSSPASAETKTAPSKVKPPVEAPVPVAQSAAEPAPVTAPPNLEVVLQTGLKAKSDAALVIANSDYVWLEDIPYAQRDAQLIRDMFRETLGVPKYRIRMVSEANRWEILKALQKVRYRVRAGGTLWVYYVGHSDLVGDDRDPAILGEDAELTDEGKVRGAVTVDEMLDTLSQTNAARIVFIMDTAFNGRSRDGGLIFDTERPAASGLQRPPRDNVALWVAARDGTGTESWRAVEHGLFSWCLAGAFRGWADGATGDEPDGTVTLGEAQQYVYQSMRRLGRTQLSSLDGRPEIRAWPLLSAELEVGPPPEHWQVFFLQDRVARMAAATAEIEAAAKAEWEAAYALASEGGDEGRQALEAFAARWEHPVLDLRWVPYLSQVDEARRLYEHYGEWQQRPESEEPVAEGAEGADAAGAADTAEPEGVLDDSCDDLLALEEPAIAGALRPGQIDCLEARIQEEELQTTKDKISRVLLVDAEKKGDRERWEKLVVRHLEEIDQSDPDFCFKYAVFLSRQGLERAEDTLWWATRALENKDQWAGSIYEKKVYMLRRVRAEAASDLWSASEEQYLDLRTMEAEANADHFRGKAKMFARDWLEYARLTNQPDQAALEMCLAAAGAVEYCRGK